MKINTLRKNKRVIIGGLITLSACCLAIMTEPTYKYISNDNLDKEKIAVYIKNETGNYEKSNSIPTTGYILNEEKSICNNEAIPSWNLETNSLKLKNLIKGNTSCYLYFDEYCEGKGEACKKILENKTVSARNKITGPLTENTTGKMFLAEDNDGMSYYFAGAVDNNWVRFANNYWRIIRVNGDGSIRMIYNGPTTDQTGETTQIGTSAFNEKTDDNAYVGYMYGTPGSSTYEETHANINDSTIKKVVDNWYKDNIANNTNYSDKVDVNAGFCNDRSRADANETLWIRDTKLGYGNNETAYRSLGKTITFDDEFKDELFLNFKCINKENDLFTLKDSINGNKKLIYPIGLLTMDEMLTAGYFMKQGNLNFYLYNGYSFWTMTPIFAANSPDFRAHVMPLIPNGSTIGWATFETHGVRPVINLRANITLTGKGTKDNPFVVQ